MTRNRSRETAAAALIITACVIAFFAEPIFTAKVFSPAALLYEYPPWNRHAPADYVRPNSGQADRINHHNPWRMFNRESIRHGEVPLWNPFGFAGAPHLANYQSAPLYPLSLLATPLPFETGQLGIVMAHLFTAGFFTWFFLRRHGISVAGALLGALSFTFSGALILWLSSPGGFVVPWLPPLMYVTLRFVEAPGSAWWLAVVAVVAVQFFAGHPESSHYIVFMATAFFVFRWWPHRRRLRWTTLGAYGAACGAGALVAAAQILPFLEYLPATHQGAGAGDFSPASLLPRPRLLPMVALVFPYVFGHPAWGDREFTGALGLPLFNEMAGVYVGVVPLLLAVWTAWTCARADATVRFFAACAVVALAYFYWLPPVFGVLKLMPLFNASRTLIVPALSNFCLAYLAARGLDTWRARFATGDAAIGAAVIRRLVVAALIIAIAVGVAQLGLAWQRDRIVATGLARLERLTQAQARLGEVVGAWRGAAFWRDRVPVIYADARFGAATPLITAVILLGAAGLVAGARRYGSTGLAAGAIALALADLFLFGVRVNAASDRRDVYPATESIRFLQADRTLFRVTGLNQVLTPTTGMPYGLADARGMDALWPRRYVRLLHADGTLVNSNVANPFWYPHYRSRALDLANVTYVLADAPLPDLPLAFAGDMLIYRRPHALPRAWLVGEVEPARDEADALSKVLAPGFDPRRRAVVEGLVSTFAESHTAEPGRADVVTYAPRRVVVQTTTAVPALLVLADGYDAGWRAFVRGEARPIHLTNYAFRGVVVPAGTSEVEFRYEPRAFTAGAWISLAAAASAVAVALVGARVRRRRPSP
jgi:hypothetical protein